MKKQIEILAKYVFDLLDVLFVRKRYIVFGTRAANDYADNSKVLFEYFLEQNVEDVYFYTKKRSILRRIPKNGLYAYSLKGVYVLLKSRLLIFTHGSGDFYPFFPNKCPNRVFINLFHAIAVKRVSTRNNAANEKEARKWNYFLVSSKFESKFVQECNDLLDEQIIVMGQPRNDILVNQRADRSNALIKSILYAPTFRDTTYTKLFPFEDLDLRALDAFLLNNGMEIIIRLHINDEKRYRNLSEYDQLQRIKFSGSNETASVNDVLSDFDMVISDYSSIIIDFLLLNKPVAYMPYDFAEYELERGFSFDFHEHRAGPILNSQKELCTFLLNKEDDYREKRVALRNLFHEYQDGKSTERLFNFITNL